MLLSPQPKSPCARKPYHRSVLDRIDRGTDGAYEIGHAGRLLNAGKLSIAKPNTSHLSMGRSQLLSVG